MFSKTVRQIERTLEKQSIDYQAVIQELGQAEAVKLREGGKSFCLTDHVRGLVLAQLSSQRPWGPIARNLSRIGKIFLGYNPKKLKKADPNDLVAAIKDLKCGNLKIAAQMKALVSNIGVLERIALDHESIDCYVTSESPTIIAKELGKGKRYKLQEVGFTLAMEYLKNVGISAIKPDVHICRIIGPERLGLADRQPTPEDAVAILMRLTGKQIHNAVYIDNLLWMFAAKNYGNICATSPKCDVCLVSRCHQKIA